MKVPIGEAWKSQKCPSRQGPFDDVMVGTMNPNTSTTEDPVQDEMPDALDEAFRNFSENLDVKQMPDACGSCFQNFFKTPDPGAPTISPRMTMRSGIPFSPVNRGGQAQ